MINQFGQFIPDYPGQQYWQDPAYMRYISQQHQQPMQQAQQVQGTQMSQANQQPSSRMVEVVPASSEQAAKEFPVPAGATQMIIGSDDSFIAVKAVSMTGQITFDIYDKRPPAPPVPALNPEDYVRRDEVATLIAEALREGKNGRKTASAEKEGE
jgi:hypothetical protein